MVLWKVQIESQAPRILLFLIEDYKIYNKTIRIHHSGFFHIATNGQ